MKLVTLKDQDLKHDVVVNTDLITSMRAERYGHAAIFGLTRIQFTDGSSVIVHGEPSAVRKAIDSASE